ncbi:uncharacterized protein LOC62_04G006412 [Vanrija pseudolonga]|uniref:Uncharacterized protein n=1 Tax=Vanrija pseudolonga TaxID=143232 RepID=A0AAF1BJN5_9TREE|nr:hypothetical protein LOC62_04G006412 [Vanrija pseudolonga]
MTKYLLTTTLGVETGPTATPSTKRFTIGIPYLYAVVFEYHTREAHPWLEPFAEETEQVSEAELERRGGYSDVAPGVKARSRD